MSTNAKLNSHAGHIKFRVAGSHAGSRTVDVEGDGYIVYLQEIGDSVTRCDVHSEHESGCVLEDLNSTNGITMNDVTIQKHQLEDGDVVSIGVHEIIYHDMRNVVGSEQDKKNTEVNQA